MFSTRLPLHPSKRHPLTGEPIRALYVDKNGRARYPMMGADEPSEADKAAAEKVAADKAVADKAAEDKAAADKAAADKAAEDGNKDLGFPKDTPVAEMKPAEQAAYHRHHARKHEDRNKEWSKVAGGKTPEELAAILKEHGDLKKASLTDGEKAVAEATANGKRAASLALAPQFFDVALSHVAEDRRKVLIDTIDVSKVITDSGEVDTDKVKTIAESLAPADKGTGNGSDYGAGRRGGGGQKSGVSAGRSLYQERHGKKSESES